MPPADPSTPAILNSPAEMRAWRRSLRSDSVGFVPTMGALHPGHAELLRRLRPRCDSLVLSIFVNPTQFGPNEDLSKYPRTFEEDLVLARACGVDAIFYPTPQTMYPVGFSTYVNEEQLSQGLCGAARPGHFRGVTTVVLKLFNLVEPRVAYFGLKDAQQFFVLHKMARDLDLDVSVEGVATVREADGLAMSSRNRFLTAEERLLAPRIHAALKDAAHQIESGQAHQAALNAASLALAHEGFRVQYLDCLELPSLRMHNEATHSSPLLIAVAAHLGSTRLIDNIIVHPERLAAHGIQVHL